MARLLLAWSAIASLAPLLGLVVSASLSVGNGRAGAGQVVCGNGPGSQVLMDLVELAPRARRGVQRLHPMARVLNRFGGMR
jgi:hypothetical protein